MIPVPIPFPCQAGSSLDKAEYYFARSVLQLEEADVLTVDLDHLGLAGDEAVVEEASLNDVVPAPDGLDVLAHCLTVQVEQEVAVAVSRGTQVPLSRHGPRRRSESRAAREASRAAERD